MFRLAFGVGGSGVGFWVVGCKKVKRLNLRTTTSQERHAIPRRARIQGSLTRVWLKSRLESQKEERRCEASKGWLTVSV